MIESVKSRMNKLEKSEAKHLGMDKVLNSGATIYGKGDMKDDLFMIDIKHTDAKTQCTIKKAEILKAWDDASEYNPPRIPVIQVNISGFKTYLLSEPDFLNYRELLQKDIDNI